MLVLFVTAALATGQPPSQAILAVGPGAFAKVSVAQDLAAVVAGVAPFGPSIPNRLVAAGTGSVTLRRTGAGLVSTRLDTGANSSTLAATALAARIVMPRAVLP